MRSAGATGPLIAGRQSDGGMLGAGRPWERPCRGEEEGVAEEQSSEGTEEEVHAEGADRGERKGKKKNGGELEDTESWVLTDANRC